MTVLRSWSRPTWGCPACRHPNRVGSQFCTACGTALPPEAQPAQTASSGSRLFRRRLKRAGIGCGGLVVLLVIVIVLATLFGSGTGDSEGADQVRIVNPEPSPTIEGAEPTPTPMPTPTPAPIPTATPVVTSTPVSTLEPPPTERLWTVEELAECDPPPPEGQMTDCQVALMLEWLSSSEQEAALGSEDAALLVVYQQRWELADTMLRTVYEDGLVTAAEAQALCSAPLQQHYVGLAEAREFARQHGLRGHEINYLRQQQAISQVQAACR